MSKVLITASQINNIKPMEIVSTDEIRQQWINLYKTIWPDLDAQVAYEREALFFNRILRDSEALRNCTPVSIYIAFIDLAVCGLSLEPGVRALAYLQPRKFKTGKKDEKGYDIYESRCCLVISGYGELVQRTRAGQILYADNPVVVYKGDSFSFSDNNGVKSVNYTLNLEHDTKQPIACFMRLTRPDGSIDYGILLEEGWKRLEGYSAKANKYYDRDKKEWIERPNALYSAGDDGAIDAGFLIAKCIKHSFKTYPKVRVGRHTTYESDQSPEDYYGLDNEPSREASEAAEAFGAGLRDAEQAATGVTVNPETSDNTDDGAW